MEAYVTHYTSILLKPDIYPCSEEIETCHQQLNKGQQRANPYTHGLWLIRIEKLHLLSPYHVVMVLKAFKTKITVKNFLKICVAERCRIPPRSAEAAPAPGTFVFATFTTLLTNDSHLARKTPLQEFDLYA
ncbi:hypothetical protein EVAR_101300_1 [Eumeta japonica]|uniref:Uncharacterized protein n=1 Tax=Eumeta variegata TaxID=151549 RepID=A0A4C1SNZ9_EUMVA|nr:hypothetical protein EVAR_101300_1 [Eumeta japonica]